MKWKRSLEIGEHYFQPSPAPAPTPRLFTALQLFHIKSWFARCWQYTNGRLPDWIRSHYPIYNSFLYRLKLMSQALLNTHLSLTFANLFLVFLSVLQYHTSYHMQFLIDGLFRNLHDVTWRPHLETYNLRSYEFSYNVSDCRRLWLCPAWQCHYITIELL